MKRLTPTLSPRTVPPVLEPAEFQNDVAVVRGSPVVLPCEAQGSPPPLVTWMKDGEPLLPQSLEQGPGLQLETVGAGDSGTYSCVATSEAGEARRHFQLTVMGGSSAPSSPCPGPRRAGWASGADAEGGERGERPGGLASGDRRLGCFILLGLCSSVPPSHVKQGQNHRNRGAEPHV